MKIICTSAPPKPVTHEIKRFVQPPPAPPPPASNDVAAEALRIAKNPPGINPKMMHY